MYSNYYHVIKNTEYTEKSTNRFDVFCEYLQNICHLRKSFVKAIDKTYFFVYNTINERG